MKRCFRCQVVKPLSDFYAHAAMKDGHINKCAECTKADVRRHRDENVEQARAKDRERSKRPERKASAAASQVRSREKAPEKVKARSMVRRAIQSGRLALKPCEVCGTTKLVHAHHDDYAKPLDVRWLCPVHHAAIHHQKAA